MASRALYEGIFEKQAGKDFYKFLEIVSKGKTNDQIRAMEYFIKPVSGGGCGGMPGMTDDEYMEIINRKKASIDFRKVALNKIGLDEDEVNEIPPAKFEGFYFGEDQFAKQRANGDWVTSSNFAAKNVA